MSKRMFATVTLTRGEVEFLREIVDFLAEILEDAEDELGVDDDED